MKYSQLIGIIATLALVITCYQPWVYVQSKDLLITGMHAPGTNFGRPGLMHVILSVVMIVFFALPKAWAKRINIFVATFNLAWAIKNYIILSTCYVGECPQKKIAIYLLLALSILILLMTFFPKIKLTEEE